jgi:two-component system chemotaxis sensor kinase CheA
MNVVKNKVEAIGGSLSIQSTIGKGTTFTLRLPISMAIVHALLVRVDNEICAIPLYNIIETIKIETALIKQVNQQKIIPYRDEVLPLVGLQKKLEFVQKSEPSSKEKICIVVCELNHQKIAFLVEEFIGQQEIVIKSLTGYMHNIKGCSGATILGNGRVAMILDLASLLNQGNYDEKYQPQAI